MTNTKGPVPAAEQKACTGCSVLLKCPSAGCTVQVPATVVADGSVAVTGLPVNKLLRPLSVCGSENDTEDRTEGHNEAPAPAYHSIDVSPRLGLKALCD